MEIMSVEGVVFTQSGRSESYVYVPRCAGSAMSDAKILSSDYL